MARGLAVRHVGGVGRNALASLIICRLPIPVQLKRKRLGEVSRFETLSSISPFVCAHPT